jgi:hypothetical protein
MEPIPPPRPGDVPMVPVPLNELFMMAAEYERAKRWPEADRLLNHILAVAPNQADSLHLAGIVSFRLGRHAQALEQMERAIAHGVDTPLYLRNICEVYRSLGRLDEALASAQRAAALSPSDPLCLHNLSVIHYERLELDESIACADRALAMNAGLPGAHFARAEALLLRGDWAEGWEEYEWRFRIAEAAPLMPPTDRPQWDGTAFSDGRLLLVADQGFGDIIQFGRYIDWVVARCPDIVIACPPEVVSIMRQLCPSAAIAMRWEDSLPFRAYVPLSGLPRLHGTRPGNVPVQAPYLRADPVRVAAWRQRLDGLVPAGFKRVGIVWAGRPTHNNDRRRSTTLASFGPIASVPRVALVSLQKGPSADQAGRYFGRAPLVNIGAEIGDYDDTMALLSSLDQVITVDTSVGHLSAALGRPTWIMLAHAPDWRWLMDREDTPWYPTVRLFRQKVAGDWGVVLRRVGSALREG